MMAKKVSRSDEEDDLKEAFKVILCILFINIYNRFKVINLQVFDRNGDGTISSAEFRQVKNSLQSYLKQIIVNFNKGDDEFRRKTDRYLAYKINTLKL